MSLNHNTDPKAIKEYICKNPAANDLWKEIEEKFGEEIDINLVEHGVAKFGGFASWKAVYTTDENGFYQTTRLIKPTISISSTVPYYKKIEYCIVELFNLSISETYDNIMTMSYNDILDKDECVRLIEDIEFETVIKNSHNMIKFGVEYQFYDKELLESAMNENDKLKSNVRYKEHFEEIKKNLFMR